MADPILEIRGLHVYYGESHAIQGIDLDLEQGVLSVVGRNGMGKTTLCNTLTGLKAARAGSIRLAGREVSRLAPHAIQRLGVGYVPQGRRVWPSLTVEEHLELAAAGARGARWTVERVYQTFPRLAERLKHGGAQLSGGEQQMLAIARALLGNPRLLVMDEPTEGLAPAIVAQVKRMLVELARNGELSVLLIEQNIGVATEVAETVAIMVNGRINRLMAARALAADRDLQYRLVGVGRHGEEAAPVAEEVQERVAQVFRIAREGAGAADDAPAFQPVTALPNRWGVSVLGGQAHKPRPPSQEPPMMEKVFSIPLSERIGRMALVAGTFDTKGRELKFIRDRLRELKIPVRTVDLSTSGKPSTADVPPLEVASAHPGGSAAVFSDERGPSVEAMAIAFARWIERERDIGGIISAGGSGGTALATPAMRRLPVGIPKVMVSTVASGDVGAYVGASDIMMVYSVADVQGINAITEQVLGNAAHALAGMIAALPDRAAREARAKLARPAIGITMFGVTTPCVQALVRKFEEDYDCLVFHATGTGGRSMENLADSGLLAGLIDVTTTEVADMLVGGVFPADADRFGAAIRTELPYVGSTGALDMVNFGPRPSVPERFKNRRFVIHNPQVTLMRTARDENAAIGRWIGERLNLMEGSVRFLLPERGVSLLDAPGQPFHDPEADAALFESLETTVRQTGRRRIERVPAHINDPAFVEALADAFTSIAPPLLKRA